MAIFWCVISYLIVMISTMNIIYAWDLRYGHTDSLGSYFVAGLLWPLLVCFVIMVGLREHIFPFIGKVFLAPALCVRRASKNKKEDK